MKYVFLSLSLIVLPQVTKAAMQISEVAWMGNSTSANAEWIELQNTGGSSIDVTGWTLSDGMNLNIELAGAGGAGQFAVLERTSEDSAPGSAFLIYTGALVNTGATLTLRNQSGGIEDQVAGGENWENIGGDNTTKETAQLGSSGWITAAATPGRVNATVGTTIATEENDESETTTTTSTSKSSGSSKSGSSGPKKIPLVLPDVTLELTLRAPERGYVNQPLEFTLEPSQIGRSLQQSLVYEWNFGDGEVGSGKSPTHTYRYPGTYVVMVRAAYARQHATTRHEVTILPVTFSLTKNTAGDIQIHNNAKYEVDLSGYTLMAEKSFTLPPMTILLPAATLTIPRSQVGESQHLVALADTADTIVATLGGTRLPELASRSVTPAVARSVPTTPPTPVPISFAPTPAVLAATSSANTEATRATSLLPAGSIESTPPAPAWPYLALAALVGVGFASVFVGRKRSSLEEATESLQLTKGV